MSSVGESKLISEGISCLDGLRGSGPGPPPKFKILMMAVLQGMWTFGSLEASYLVRAPTSTITITIGLNIYDEERSSTLRAGPFEAWSFYLLN